MDFFCFAVLFALALAGYIIVEGCLTLKDHPEYMYAYLTFSVTYCFLFALQGLYASKMPFRLATFLSIIASPAFYYFANLLWIFGFIDIVRLINLAAHFADDDLMPFRLWWMACGLIAIVVTFFAGYFNFLCPRVRHATIAAQGLLAQGQSLRILLVSDIHLGYFIRKSRWRKWVDLMNAQNPDIIFLVGDTVDNFFEPVTIQRLHEEFNQLHPRFGVFAVDGNHDPGALPGWFLSYTDVIWLSDSVTLVNESFYVVGRRDWSSYSRSPLDDVVSGCDRTKPIIVLDHQPRNLAEAEACGVTLQLSGHTHAGQFFPVTAIVPFLYENSHGLSRRGNTQYYVSSGLGVWGPECRFTSNSEIVNITLTW
jgi:predicted MPP superfamily phosphohydrolase